MNMRVLVVGGTGFLGGAIAQAANSAGQAVTAFTRGRTGGRVPLGVQSLVGDRHVDLSPLHGQHFDAVIDTCAFTPDAVAALLDALPSTVGRYVLVSSISVYADLSRPNVDEDGQTSRATEEQLDHARSVPVDQRSSAAAYGGAYGALKREAELVALARLGQRALILRSGLLVGAGDYTDRLTYWVRRIDLGGTVPLPGEPERLMQLIDVRDAASFVVRGVEQGLGGIFNLTGRPMSMGTLFEQCRLVSGSDARFVWMEDERVLAVGLEPWSDVPLWLPKSDSASRYILEVDTGRAFSAGLTARPLPDTLRRILAWDRTRRDVPLKAGMSPDKEALLLGQVPTSGANAD